MAEQQSDRHTIHNDAQKLARAARLSPRVAIGKRDQRRDRVDRVSADVRRYSFLHSHDLIANDKSR